MYKLINIYIIKYKHLALMLELVDKPDLKSGAKRLAGSSPARSIKDIQYTGSIPADGTEVNYDKIIQSTFKRK